MGNYYEGRMTFNLKKDLPKELLYELKILSSGSEHSTEYFKVLKDTKWLRHERYDYPEYILYIEDRCYVFDIKFCMKGYRYEGYNLGEDIYEFLKQYIDKSMYDMSGGGYIGRIQDEDETYDKTFYVDYDLFYNEIERRKFLCNKDCWYFRENNLCDKYTVCERAYELGKLWDGKDSNKKYKYHVSLSADGWSDGYVYSTKGEAEIVAYATDTRNWKEANLNPYSGDFEIDLDNPEEIDEKE